MGLWPSEKGAEKSGLKKYHNSYRIVAHGTGKMAHQKSFIVAQRPVRLQPGRSREREAVVAVPGRVYLVRKVSVRRSRQLRLFVQQRKDAVRLRFNQLCEGGGKAICDIKPLLCFQF